MILDGVEDGTSGGGRAGVPVAVAGLTPAPVFLRSAKIPGSTPEKRKKLSPFTRSVSAFKTILETRIKHPGEDPRKITASVSKRREQKIYLKRIY